MSDVMDMSEVLEGQVDQDLAKQAAEADLIPAGRYVATIESYTVRRADREYFDEAMTAKNPFYGQQLVNARVVLMSKRAGSGKDAPLERLDRPRTLFLRLCPAAVMDRKGGLSNESKLFGQLVAISRQATNAAVMDWFLDHAVEVTITLSEAAEKDGRQFEAKNWVRGFRAAH